MTVKEKILSEINDISDSSILEKICAFIEKIREKQTLSKTFNLYKKHGFYDAIVSRVNVSLLNESQRYFYDSIENHGTTYITIKKFLFLYDSDFSEKKPLYTVSYLDDLLNLIFETETRDERILEVLVFLLNNQNHKFNFDKPLKKKSKVKVDDIYVRIIDYMGTLESSYIDNQKVDTVLLQDIVSKMHELKIRDRKNFILPLATKGILDQEINNENSRMLYEKHLLNTNSIEFFKGTLRKRGWTPLTTEGLSIDSKNSVHTVKKR